MYCEQCGIELPDGLAFCSGCGASQGGILVEIGAAETPVAEKAPEKAPAQGAPEKAPRIGVTYASGFGGLKKKQAPGNPVKPVVKSPLKAAAKIPEKKTKSSCSCASLAIVSVFIVGLFVMGIPGFVASRNHEQYTKCVSELQSLRSAQEKYREANGVYTDSVPRLAMYAVPGCKDPEGQGANCEVAGRLKESCSGGAWINADADSYYIYSIVDRCSICLSKSEMAPADYIGCYEKLNFSQTCAKLGKK